MRMILWTIAYNWTQASSNADEWYFFSRKNMIIGTIDSMPTGQTSSIELKWLVKNTTASSISGATANAYGGSTGGYWTLTPVSNDPTHAWSIGGSSYEPYNGNMGAYYVGNPETWIGDFTLSAAVLVHCADFHRRPGGRYAVHVHL